MCRFPGGKGGDIRTPGWRVENSHKAPLVKHTGFTGLVGHFAHGQRGFTQEAICKQERIPYHPGANGRGGSSGFAREICPERPRSRHRPTRCLPSRRSPLDLLLTRSSATLRSFARPLPTPYLYLMPDSAQDQAEAENAECDHATIPIHGKVAHGPASPFAQGGARFPCVERHPLPVRGRAARGRRRLLRKAWGRYQGMARCGVGKV